MCDIFPNVIIAIVHDCNSDALRVLLIWGLDFSEFPMGSIKTLIIVHIVLTAHHAESPQLTANVAASLIILHAQIHLQFLPMSLP